MIVIERARKGTALGNQLVTRTPRSRATLRLATKVTIHLHDDGHRRGSEGQGERAERKKVASPAGAPKKK